MHTAHTSLSCVIGRKVGIDITSKKVWSTCLRPHITEQWKTPTHACILKLNWTELETTRWSVAHSSKFNKRWRLMNFRGWMRSAQCNNVSEIVVKKKRKKEILKWQLPVFHEELRSTLCAERCPVKMPPFEVALVSVAPLLFSTSHLYWFNPLQMLCGD